MGVSDLMVGKQAIYSVALKKEKEKELSITKL